MPTMRGKPGVAALDNKIYVTGGWGDDGQTMSSVDCYDPDTNTWSQMANMNIASLATWNFASVFFCLKIAQHPKICPLISKIPLELS